MKRNLFKLLFVGISFISCASNVNPTKKDEPKNKVEEINLELFSSIPIEIDGCGCSFYATENDKKDGKYICVNDFANLAFIKLNGQMVKFTLSEHKEDSNTYIYKNREYTLKVEITRKQAGDYEMSNVEGIITISFKEYSKEQKFVGTCGC